MFEDMPSSKRKPPAERQFTVYRIKGAKAVPVAVVAAKDEAAAVARVIADRGIKDEDERRRLFARDLSLP